MTTLPIAPPGTWLADVDRQVTVHIVQLINLAEAGLEMVKNRIVVGVNVAGDQPEQIEDRADYVTDTAREALTDIAAVRDLVALATATIASVAVDSGAPYEEICESAAAHDDPRVLHALNDQLVRGVEQELVTMIDELARRLARTSG